MRAGTHCMRRRLSNLLMLASLAACHIEHDHVHDHDPAIDGGGDPAPCTSTVTAIEHVTVITMELGSVPTPDTTVLVDKQRVVWIGPAEDAPIPAGATRIDGHG